MVADVSIVSLGFLILVAALSVAILAGVVVWARGRGPAVKILAGVLAVMIVSLNAGAWVNRYFDYLPTWDELLGKRAEDAASAQQVDDQKTVPKRGKVIAIDIPPGDSGFSPRTAQIYLPPAYFAKPRPRLGVVILLAGEPGTMEDWTHGGDADVTSDAYAAAHGGRAPILVMADNNGGSTADTECVGPAEVYLTEVVPQFVARRYDVSTEPAQWAIGGLSEGGMCGVMLALRHPDAFRTFLDFSGLAGPRSGDDNSVGSTVKDYFRGDEADFEAHEPKTILERGRFPGMGGWFQVGTADGAPYAAQQELAPAARAAGIEVCAVEVPGGEHTFQLWAQAFKDSLPWLAARVGGRARVACPDA